METLEGLVVFSVIFCILFKFMYNNHHLLVSLLSLEFMMLSVCLGLFLCLNLIGSGSLVFLYFLVMVVCEAVLGLCLLISCSYVFSSDLMKNLSCLMN